MTDPRSQPKRQSLAESIFNVAVGLLVSLGCNAIVFPYFGVHLNLAENVAVSGFYTVVSIVRSYTLRRLFNWWHVRTRI